MPGKLRKGYDATRCAETVMGDFHGHQCTRPAVVHRDGIGYCRQHDPEAVRAKREAQNAKWQAEWARNAAKRRIVSLRSALADAALAYVESYYAPERRAELTALATKVREAEADLASDSTEATDAG